LGYMEATAEGCRDAADILIGIDLLRFSFPGPAPVCFSVKRFREWLCPGYRLQDDGRCFPS